jgi:hypothetical protein
LVIDGRIRIQIRICFSSLSVYFIKLSTTNYCTHTVLTLRRSGPVQIMTDLDPGGLKTYGSGSTTLLLLSGNDAADQLARNGAAMNPAW